MSLCVRANFPGILKYLHICTHTLSECIIHIQIIFSNQKTKIIYWRDTVLPEMLKIKVMWLIADHLTTYWCAKYQGLIFFLKWFSGLPAWSSLVAVCLTEIYGLDMWRKKKISDLSVEKCIDLNKLSCICCLRIM